jgi:putative intracellular protease/amidase
MRTTRSREDQAMTRDRTIRYAVVLLAHGFNETEAVAILTELRRSGIQAKSLGLVSGLIGGAHGIWIMPDLTLTDLGNLATRLSIDLVVLPADDAYLAAIRPDPRVRELLQQVAGRGGWIATNTTALGTLRDMLPRSTEAERGQTLLHFPEQPVEAFAEELVLHYLQQTAYPIPPRLVSTEQEWR